MEPHHPPTPDGPKLMLQRDRVSGVPDCGVDRPPLEDQPTSSPFAISAKDADALVGTGCHAYLKYDFDADVAVHRGVFSAIKQALEPRPHFTHRVGQSVLVTMSVPDTGTETAVFANEVANYIAGLLPNANLVSAEIGQSERQRRVEAMTRLRDSLDEDRPLGI